MGFNNIAKEYKSISITQKQAAKRLISLVDDSNFTNILDIGCASGVNIEDLSIKFAKQSKYTGIDPSANMIEMAKNKYSKNYDFICTNLEDFNSKEVYDLIFCNSVFYYFKDKTIFFDKCNQLLAQNGAIAIQAQARLCKLFEQAIDYTKSNPLTKKQMQSFKFPANLISEKEFLKILYKQQYFSVEKFYYYTDLNKVNVDTAMKIFKSGPAVPCLSDSAFKSKPTQEFKKLFLDSVESYLAQNTDSDGLVSLDSPRIYIVLKRQY